MSRREMLDSWKDIAAYLKRDIRTCQSWEKELGLPVHRLNDSPKARVFAYKDEIDRWMREKLKEREAHEGPARKRRAKRIRTVAAVFLILGSGTFLFWRFVVRPSGASAGPAIAVLDFENLSKDPGLDPWKDGLPELLITGLSQSRFVNVYTRDQVRSVLKKLGLSEAREFTSDDLDRIAAEAGLTQLVTGSFLKAGEGIVITLTLLAPRTRQIIGRMNAECRNPSEIIPKMNDLVLLVKQELNLSRAQMATDAEIYKQVEVATTGSPEAYRYYLEGRRLHHQMAYAQAIAYMEKAVSIDPQFAMAYRSMASAYRNLGHMARAREYARKALDGSARLSELERLIIEGFYKYWDGDYAGSTDIWEMLLRLYPDNLTAYTTLSTIIPDLDRVIALREHAYRHFQTAVTAYNLIDAYMQKGLYQKAEDISRSFLQDIEDNSGVRDGLLLTYLCRRRFDLALDEAEKISLPRPDNEYYRTEWGDVLLLMGDLAGAEAVYRQVPVLKAYINRSNLMVLDLARGKFEDAIAVTRRNLADAGSDIRLKSGAYEDLVSTLEKAGRCDEAGRVWAEYLEVSAEWRRSGDDDTKDDVPGRQRAALFVEARIQAERGALVEARQSAGRLKGLCDKTGDPRELRYPEYVLGLIELGKKNPRQAVEYFDRAYSRLRCEVRWESSRDFALFYDGLARALHESGDLDKARQIYEKITLLTVGRLSHGDIYAKAFYRLGLIADRQGDKDRARENYSKFLGLWKDADPGLAEVEDARSRLAALGD
jgi:tetratricopeptide (TPR) repeat protein/TolB-like protein